MVRQAANAIERWAWFLPTRHNSSADQFTARMIDKYGQAFYDAWTPREQDRYATLRLREEAGIQYPRRPLVPRAAFLASLIVASVFAVIAALQWLPTDTMNLREHITKSKSNEPNLSPKYVCPVRGFLP